jgi:prepilin-type N-terminal cleavage/methylation domain-containing protein
MKQRRLSMAQDEHILESKMASPQRARGFTLIELLVVIAIIGILSAVVLGALDIARAKGVDAGIKSNLHAFQTQAILDYDGFPEAYSSSTVATLGALSTTYPVGTGVGGDDGVGPFDGDLGGDGTAENALNQAAIITGGGIQFGYSPTAYVVQAALVAATSTYWCIDSVNDAKQETGLLPPAAVSCP